MDHWFELVGPNHAVSIFGIKLVGVNAENGLKLLFSIVLVVVMVLLSRLMRRLTRLAHDARKKRTAFWARQAVGLTIAVLTVIGLASIWFDDPGRLTGALGLFSAGVAFALQRVITAFAGYFVILRGNTFNVGDRITMGGVRGDVIALGFMQTTIMEMGQPPAVQSAEPAMWVQARQYTGRIVSVSNAQVFEEPIYNYTRDFPYIWEEMSVPIAYKADRRRVEDLLLAAANRHTLRISELGKPALEELKRRYVVEDAELKPRVYMRMTDNWIEVTVRFLVEDHKVRSVKDAMTRDILAAMESAGIGVASTTIEIVGFPPVPVNVEEIRRSA